MRVGSAGGHFGGDPDRFHELLLGRTLFQCELRVTTDAIGALGHMRYCDRNELLGFGRQRAVGEDALAECSECVVDFRARSRRFCARSFETSGYMCSSMTNIPFNFDCASSFQPNSP